MVVDSHLKDLTESLPAEDLASVLDDVPGGWLDEASATRNVLPALTEHCRQIAEERSRPIRDSALARARATLASEVDRLRALAKVNRNLRKQEIVLAERELQRVAEHIAAARLRLDAIRLIAS